MNSEQQNRLWGQIVAKAWNDNDFRKRLLANPTTVMKEMGLEVAPGTQVRVVENSDDILYLVLPAKPDSEKLPDLEIEAHRAEQVVGGFIAHTRF